MLSPKDLEQIERKGISEQQIKKELEEFKTGFPFLKLDAAASIGNGIIATSAEDVKRYTEAWNAYKAEGKKIVKFVPASGAASRMFKNMFAFLTADYDVPTTDFEKTFFDNVVKFAFYPALNAMCEKNEGKNIEALMGEGNYKAVVANLLEAKGLNYGQLPKGLLLFHSYEDGARTPLEEHLVEGALYADSKGMVHIHYTVSPEHRTLFEKKVADTKDKYE